MNKYTEKYIKYIAVLYELDPVNVIKFLGHLDSKVDIEFIIEKKQNCPRCGDTIR